MAEIKTEIFNVNNVDCPSCAAKIENGLNALDGIDDAVFDFANLTLHVKSDDIKRIIDEVRRIEPEVELVPKSAGTASGSIDEASGDCSCFLRLGFIATLISLWKSPSL
jgi:Cd2+/Zn2+-exporting ATPase